MAQRSNIVECPVCLQSFVSWMINGHVEQCLSQSEEKEVDTTCKTNKMKDGPSSFKISDISPSLNISKSPIGSSTITSPPPSKKVKVGNLVPHLQSPRTEAKSGRKRSNFVPLAEKLRPQTLAEYVGQTHVVGEKCILKNLLETEEIPSIIFWGPPGCGKVSLFFVLLYALNTPIINPFCQLRLLYFSISIFCSFFL